MKLDTDQLRSELEGKLRPPVEVMLDPSLLVASSALQRLSNSGLFEARTQATLGHDPTEARVAGLHIPAAFVELLGDADRIDVPTTTVWNFYRGQAESAEPNEIVEQLDAYGIEPFDERAEGGLDWAIALDDSQRDDRLFDALEEERAFLAQGGVLLSRTPTALDAMRDAGVATIDLGRAQMTDAFGERLADFGYGDAAGICAFGISGVPHLASALVGDLLENHADLVCYRLGR